MQRPPRPDFVTGSCAVSLSMRSLQYAAPLHCMSPVTLPMPAPRRLPTLLEARLAHMPGSTRAKLQVNLAEIRRAAEEINAALAEQPGDPLLEELLLKTYQDELAVLANVNQMTNALATTADPASAAERLRL